VYCDLFLFLALTGCRLGEALRLQWNQVDWHHQRFMFVKTKNRRDHTLPITGLLKAVLARRMVASKSSPRVFGTVENGGRLGNVGRAVRWLRHTACVYFTSHVICGDGLLPPWSRRAWACIRSKEC